MKLKIFKKIKNFKKNFSCSEKTATNVTVYFPQLGSGSTATRKVTKINVPDADNNGGFLTAYDPSADSAAIVGGNIAVLELSTPITLENGNFFYF